MKINLNHKIQNDKYTEYIYEAFDIQNKEESNVTIEANLEHLPKQWNIGVVYGGSGTGKTTILKNYFKKEMDKSYFDNSKSLISNFDWLEPKEATFLLSAMGLSSVPTWLRPFNTLSNGEQYRANLAYIVGMAKNDEVILIDEYTSVVDRDVAKAMSNALQKYIRRTNKKIVLASCHFDIMEWLQPDWIYSPSKGRLEIASHLRQPSIELQIFRCRYETWRLFKQHHYLTEDLNKAANSYVILLNDKPVAFIGILPFPHGNIQNGYRISRIVVLPDFQGLGLGSKLCDYISSLYFAENRTMYIKTSNPALWKYFDKSENWKFTNEVTQDKLNSEWMEKQQTSDKSGMLSMRNAITKSFKWIGYKSNDDTSIIKFKSEVYKDVAQNQISMF
jgi:ABC-type lipoprotein export system ATPase subunit/ribosomal protein S18 acetylase RimI-like enzyme